MKILTWTCSIHHLHTSTIALKLQIKTLKLPWYIVATSQTSIETSWVPNVNCLICHQKSRLLRWEDRHLSTSAPVDKTVSHTSYRFFVAEGIDALLFYVFIPVDKTEIVIALFFFLLLMDESQSLVVHDNDDRSYLVWTMLGWRNHDIMRKETLATFFAA